MKLSPLSLLIGTEILLWCVLGSAIHGWQILCYPLSWMVIGGGFWLANLQYDRRHAAAHRTVVAASSRRPAMESAKSAHYTGLETSVSVN